VQVPPTALTTGAGPLEGPRPDPSAGPVETDRTPRRRGRQPPKAGREPRIPPPGRGSYAAPPAQSRLGTPWRHADHLDMSGPSRAATSCQMAEIVQVNGLRIGCVTRPFYTTNGCDLYHATRTGKSNAHLIEVRDLPVMTWGNLMFRVYDFM
jgi:hypothetical protein